ncbi:MAG: acylneuraminate cytidylyltransferase family protein [Candidatus Thermoplasmatota archaeon]
MKILSTICARGGSKGVENKNIRELQGKPLIAYTIEYLKNWDKADTMICSTDSKEIAGYAKKYGAEVPFLRPKNLATDKTAKFPVLQHAVKVCEKHYNEKYDILVDLDPTAPIRKQEDIEKAFVKFKNSNADVLYSVVEARKNPYFNMVEVDDQGYAHLSKKLEDTVVRRQDAPKVYDMNASIYIFDRDFILKNDGLHDGKEIIYVMDDISSFDIDREIDFEFIEFLLEKEVFQF